jgi:excinuclease ABC subunit C
VLGEFNLEDEVPVAALAKQEEVLYSRGISGGTRLPDRSEGLYLVQRVRDEAHRFANEGHRKRRSKVGVASILDTIPGIGPSRRKLLLERFGTLNGIREATVEEIGSVPGIPFNVAESVKGYLD